MKVAITGGAGRQCLATIFDLIENSDVEKIRLIDIDEEALDRREKRFNCEKLEVIVQDIKNIGKISEALSEYDVVLNSSSHIHNMEVMAACLESKTNYVDFGGFFPWATEQLKKHNEFERAGITGVMGAGSAPGTTNVMAKYAVDKLDQVDTVLILHAVANSQEEDAFIPPYELRTIVEQFMMNSYEFINGKLVQLPPFAGRITHSFAQPYGEISVYNMIHSSVATMPIAFKEKGIKNVAYKQAFPCKFEKQLKFLMDSGMGSTEKINVKGVDVSPREVMLALFETKTDDVYFENPTDAALFSVIVEGIEAGKPINYELELVINHYPWSLMANTFADGFPASIVMRMLGNNQIKRKGFFSSESIIDPMLFFRELERRGVYVKCKKVETIAQSDVDNILSW